VADDGVGLPPGLDLRQTETLGHQLIHMLVDKLDGAVEVVQGPGTEFRVTFRAPRE
jgi:two-component sensor histidine kinase